MVSRKWQTWALQFFLKTKPEFLQLRTHTSLIFITIYLIECVKKVGRVLKETMKYPGFSFRLLEEISKGIYGEWDMDANEDLKTKEL